MLIHLHFAIWDPIHLLCHYKHHHLSSAGMAQITIAASSGVINNIHLIYYVYYLYVYLYLYMYICMYIYYRDMSKACDEHQVIPFSGVKHVTVAIDVWSLILCGL